MDALVALLVFAFVSCVTPGPNNLMLWASGVEFGLRATLPHVVGTAIGIGLLALAVAVGLGALFTTVPELEFVMKAVGSAYLVYLAYQIAGARALSRTALARPLGLRQAAAFQAINPKAWIFALGAITTFRPPELPVAVGSIAVALIMMLVVVPTAALWATGGGILSQVDPDGRTHRSVSLVLAGLLAGTVAFVWL